MGRATLQIGATTMATPINTRTNWSVAEHWARQDGLYWRSSNGNFSFEGHALFSYRTMIGCLHPQQRVALFTNHVWSVTTTGKHQGPGIRAAIKHGWRVFVVPSLTDPADNTEHLA